MGESAALQWLLRPEEPSIRYLTLRDLVGRSEADADVVDAKAGIGRVGWAAGILAQQDAAGYWANRARLYTPKYLSTNWQLLVLSDLGLTKAHPAVRRSCELWIDQMHTSDGAFAPSGGQKGHLCTAGNTARGLIRFGYGEHPSVRRTLDWLVKSASHLGGWSCFGSGRNLDSWEGLSAFAAYPRTRWTAAMTRVVEQGAEFYLQRELHRQAGRYEPWFRTHYPIHYYYDLLVGLDVLTSLGYTDDPRLRAATTWLHEKRRRDGRWNLDAVHPDVEGGIGEWFAKNPKQRPTPFALESPGAPSKMITLTALKVQARLDGTAPR